MIMQLVATQKVKPICIKQIPQKKPNEHKKTKVQAKQKVKLLKIITISNTSVMAKSLKLLTAHLHEFHLMGMKFVIDGQDSILPL